jgi:hypothetical protein
VVRAENSRPRGSNPAIYWMVVSDASYYIPNERKRIKVAKWGTPKKYLKKNHFLGIKLNKRLLKFS